MHYSCLDEELLNQHVLQLIRVPITNQQTLVLLKDFKMFFKLSCTPNNVYRNYLSAQTSALFVVSTCLLLILSSYWILMNFLLIYLFYCLWDPLRQHCLVWYFLRNQIELGHTVFCTFLFEGFSITRFTCMYSVCKFMRNPSFFFQLS